MHKFGDFTQILLDPNTHILHSVCIFLLIEVVIKRSHVRLFKIGLKDREPSEEEEKDEKEKKRKKQCTDLDLARLPSVWMVLEMRVRVREVAGSCQDKMTSFMRTLS